MRNYTLKTPDGEVLTESKAEVIMINLKDRSIVRPKDAEYFKNYLYNTDLAEFVRRSQKDRRYVYR